MSAELPSSDPLLCELYRRRISPSRRSSRHRDVHATVAPRPTAAARARGATESHGESKVAFDAIRVRRRIGSIFASP